MLDIADEKLTEDIIKEFHRILKEGIMKTSTPKQTPKDMQKIMEWYNTLIEVTIKK